MKTSVHSYTYNDMDIGRQIVHLLHAFLHNEFYGFKLPRERKYEYVIPVSLRLQCLNLFEKRIWDPTGTGRLTYRGHAKFMQLFTQLFKSREILPNSIGLHFCASSVFTIGYSWKLESEFLIMIVTCEGDHMTELALGGTTKIRDIQFKTVSLHQPG